MIVSHFQPIFLGFYMKQCYNMHIENTHTQLFHWLFVHSCMLESIYNLRVFLRTTVAWAMLAEPGGPTQCITDASLLAGQAEMFLFCVCVEGLRIKTEKAWQKIVESTHTHRSYPKMYVFQSNAFNYSYICTHHIIQYLQMLACWDIFLSLSAPSPNLSYSWMHLFWFDLSFCFLFSFCFCLILEFGIWDVILQTDQLYIN